MQPAHLHRIVGTAVPGILVCAAGMLSAFLLRVVNAPPDAAAFVGWIFLLLLFSSIVAIVWGAIPGISLRRALLGQLFLATFIGLLLLTAGANHLGAPEILRLTALFAAWTTLCHAAAYALRRLGPGISIGLPLLLAALLIASPIVLIPVVHSAAHWGTSPTGGTSPWQPRLIELIRDTCPLLVSLDAMQSRIAIDWAHMNGMYHLSGLGADIPMSLPAWWQSTTGYALAAAAIHASAFCFRYRKKVDLRVQPAPPSRAEAV